MRIGINGFGRIGRAVIRAFYELDYKSHGLEIVAINSRSQAKQQAHLLKYDSVHGTFQHEVSHTDKSIVVRGDDIAVFNAPSPEELKWDVDVVFECSGAFNRCEQATKHNARNVIVSAPVSNADQTIIYGVNHQELNAANRVISCGSCTTNCLAPLVYVLNNKFGIESGFMTTVHAYTNDQNVIDNSHKDLRRARACGMSMIPTSTGAARMIGKVIPSLAGKINGAAVRVPVPNVSMVDFNFVAGTKLSVDDINNAIKESVSGDLNGVIGVSEIPLVSIDFLHNSCSSIFDCTETHVINDNFVRVLSWYDNEWGFSNRMLDIAVLLAR